MITRITIGISRTVFFVGCYAIKVPCGRYGWSKFLQGLLANMQEISFARLGWKELCPITFALPGGWFVVMPYARPLTASEWAAAGMGEPPNRPPGRYFLAEAKQDSFGMLNGKIVAVDYGN